jgi:MraZ protein
MPNLNGTYTSTLDPKGRVKLPSSLLKQFGEDVREFVLVRGIDTCVRLYTLEGWDVFLDSMKNWNEFDPKKRELRLKLLHGNNKVELDTADRILVPKILQTIGKLEKDLTIICLVDKVEIWDATLYEEKINSETFGNLSDLAAEAFA